MIAALFPSPLHSPNSESVSWSEDGLDAADAVSVVKLSELEDIVEETPEDHISLHVDEAVRTGGIHNRAESVSDNLFRFLERTSPLARHGANKYAVSSTTAAVDSEVTEWEFQCRQQQDMNVNASKEYGRHYGDVPAPKRGATDVLQEEDSYSSNSQEEATGNVFPPSMPRVVLSQEIASVDDIRLSLLRAGSPPELTFRILKALHLREYVSKQLAAYFQIVVGQCDQLVEMLLKSECNDDMTTTNDLQQHSTATAHNRDSTKHRTAASYDSYHPAHTAGRNLRCSTGPPNFIRSSNDDQHHSSDPRTTTAPICSAARTKSATADTVRYSYENHSTYSLQQKREFHRTAAVSDQLNDNSPALNAVMQDQDEFIRNQFRDNCGREDVCSTMSESSIDSTNLDPETPSHSKVSSRRVRTNASNAAAKVKSELSIKTSSPTNPPPSVERGGAPNDNHSAHHTPTSTHMGIQQHHSLYGASLTTAPLQPPREAAGHELHPHSTPEEHLVNYMIDGITCALRAWSRLADVKTHPSLKLSSSSMEVLERSLAQLLFSVQKRRLTGVADTSTEPFQDDDTVFAFTQGHFDLISDQLHRLSSQMSFIDSSRRTNSTGTHSTGTHSTGRQSHQSPRGHSLQTSPRVTAEAVRAEYSKGTGTSMSGGDSTAAYYSTAQSPTASHLHGHLMEYSRPRRAARASRRSTTIRSSNTLMTDLNFDTEVSPVQDNESLLSKLRYNTVDAASTGEQQQHTHHHHNQQQRVQQHVQQRVQQRVQQHHLQQQQHNRDSPPATAAAVDGPNGHTYFTTSCNTYIRVPQTRTRLQQQRQLKEQQHFVSAVQSVAAVAEGATGIAYSDTTTTTTAAKQHVVMKSRQPRLLHAAALNDQVTSLVGPTKVAKYLVDPSTCSSKNSLSTSRRTIA
eukprot:Lankesteria_metandrocarpae@DN1496_c0_g1_i1.p1